MSSPMRPADASLSTDSNDEIGELIPIAERQIQDRSTSILTQRSNISTVLSNVHSPFDGFDFDNSEYGISAEALMALRDGCELDYFIDHCAEDVLPILKGAAVAPVGQIKAKDVDVLQAFGRETMLTRHLDAADDPHWQQNWESFIARRSSNSSQNLEVGWEETVTLGAYVVYLKNLANPDHGALIPLLLQKIGSGAAPKSVWGYDSVRAVVNFHWQHWAKRLLLISFILFLIWTTSFSAYLVLYIDSPLHNQSCWKLDDGPTNFICTVDSTIIVPETGNGSMISPLSLNCTWQQTQDEPQQEVRNGTSETSTPQTNAEFLAQRRLASTHLPLAAANAGRRGHGKSLGHRVKDPDYKYCEDRIVKRRFGSFTDDPVQAAATRALSILSFAVMCPFMIEEYYTMVTLGYEWLSLANLVDFSTHSIQTIIFICHLTNFGLAKEWFAYLLAFQTVLLSMRVLRFFKLLGEGTTFLDTAVAVIYDVRYWIGYIMLTGVAASLSLGILYKPNSAFRAKHKEFRSTTKSLVTTFQIIFGTFDMEYIFDAGKTYEWVMFIFFFGFQVLMTITVLNLLIAAMSESYSKVAADKVMRMHQSRAQVIAEFETLKLPRCMKRKPKNYIHFLVVEEKSKQEHLSRNASVRPAPSRKFDDSTANAVEDLRSEVRHMQVKLDELLKVMRNSPTNHPQTIQSNNN